MLLPWYVNGTLEGVDFELVEAHLRVCITCRREVAEQQRLAETIRRSPLLDLASHASFARLMQRIAQERSQANRRKRGWNGLQPRWARLSEWLSGVRVPQPAWVAVPFFMLLFALVPAIWWWLPSTPQTPHQYRTQASPNRLPAGVSNEIRVVFLKTLNEEEVRQVVLSLNAEIAAGPSAAGVYTLRFAARESTNKATLDRLRHHPGVLVAEPIPSQDGSSDRGR